MGSPAQPVGWQTSCQLRTRGVPWLWTQKARRKSLGPCGLWGCSSEVGDDRYETSDFDPLTGQTEYACGPRPLPHLLPAPHEDWGGSAGFTNPTAT